LLPAGPREKIRTRFPIPELDMPAPVSRARPSRPAASRPSAPTSRPGDSNNDGETPHDEKAIALAERPAAGRGGQGIDGFGHGGVGGEVDQADRRVVGGMGDVDDQGDVRVQGVGDLPHADSTHLLQDI